MYIKTHSICMLIKERTFHGIVVISSTHASTVVVKHISGRCFIDIVQNIFQLGKRTNNALIGGPISVHRNES